MILVTENRCELKGLCLDVLCELTVVLLEIEKKTGMDAEVLCDQLKHTIEVHRKDEACNGVTH